ILGDIVNMNPGNVGFELLVHTIQNSTDFGRDQCWNILQELPLTLSSFDLWTRLLKTTTTIFRSPTQIPGTTQGQIHGAPANELTISHLVTRAALGRFLQHCVTIIEGKEVEEIGFNDGRNTDLDPAVLRLSSSIYNGATDDSLNEDEWFGVETVMQGFALRYVKFEGASELYRSLVHTRPNGRGRGG
ncbi:11111_t:CDS:2, partial [Acaulospora colombiana]